MVKAGSIYVLQDPVNGEIRYVGKTIQKIQKRMENHLSPCKLQARTKKTSWIKSLKAKGMLPNPIKIQEVLVKDLNDAEIYWISYFKSIGCPLTNGTDGGDGASIGPRIISPEELERIRAGARRNHSILIVEVTTGMIFSSAREAAKHFNIHNASIAQVLKHKRNSLFGLVFKYLSKGE